MSWTTTAATTRKNHYKNSQMLPVREWGVIGVLGSGGNSITIAVTIDLAYAVPLYLPTTSYVDAIFCEVSTGSAGNIRMSLYKDVDGIPVTKLVTETEITSAGSTGVKQQSIGMTLPYGLYWGVAVFSSTPSVRGAAVAITNACQWNGQSTNTATTNSVGSTVSHTYGVLPSTYGTPTLISTVPPRILMRIGKNSDAEVP